MTLLVELPETYVPERQYVVSVLLQTFLGLDVRLQSTQRDDVRISADDGRQLIVADGLFAFSREEWLSTVTIPAVPLTHWMPPSEWADHSTQFEPLPIVFAPGPGGPSAIQSQDGRIVRLNIDIFGTCFFFMTRYEELASPARDRWGRFPAAASLAKRAGVLQRPVVNEYLEFLWACLRRLWPEIRRATRTYSLRLTHDVDSPFASFAGPIATARALAGDLLKRRSPTTITKRVISRMVSLAGQRFLDPYDTFDFLVAVAEEHDQRAAFYFMASEDYDIDHPWIRDIIRLTGKRGHEVGLHPGFGTSHDHTLIQEQFSRLRAVCGQLKIEQAIWGGRQHGLRWENPATWRAWTAAGLDYDSTLVFAEHPGFRCGTCYSFPVFDLRSRCTLPLWERPLVVMDTTLFSYMHLDLNDAADVVSRLAATCRRYGGEMVTLWHNNKIVTPRQRRWYSEVVGDLV